MTDIKLPEQFVTLQVTGVQNLTGRQHSHVRVFGYREHDPNRIIFEVPLQACDAAELIETATDQQFSLIEVPLWALVKPTYMTGLQILHFGSMHEDPDPPGRRSS